MVTCHKTYVPSEHEASVAKGLRVNA
jgi:hypothetical protein